MTPAPASLVQTDYFTGEFLTTDDYAAEQAYQIAIQRAGAAALYDYGLVSGLGVGESDGIVGVGAGLAIDRAGRQLFLPEDVTAPARPAGATVLAIAYAEQPSPARAGGVGTIAEVPRLVWSADAETLARTDDTALVLGTGTPLIAAGRRYAGMAAGTLVLERPPADGAVTMTGWSAPPLLGLRIDADPLVVTAPPTGAGDAPAGRLSIGGGTLGIGTLSPQAHLDVLAPVVALDGPGRLTSFDRVVRGTSAALGSTLHIGDLVMTTDRDGRATQARVVSITAPAEIITDAALNCLHAPFTFEQVLAASVRGDDGRTALAIGRDGLVGIGIETPAAQLHLGTGDLELSTDGATIGFGGDGTIATADRTSRIQFESADARTLFAQQGAIAWTPGRDTPSPPTGMILDAGGRVGIGTASPGFALEVAGALRLTDGALIFPDGTLQRTAMCAVPVGAVIDWWQGASTNVPPENFMICSGGEVTYERSPFHKKLVPNLSGQFVYGLPASGAVGPPAAADPAGSSADDAPPTRGADTHDHQFATPAHQHDYPHTHPDIHGVTDIANGASGYWGTANYNAAKGHTHNWTGSVGAASTLHTGDNMDAGQSITTADASTLPPYVALLKLIRIW